MLLLALSCLQGRPMQSAAEELLALGVDGLQLTPGNAPTRDFSEWLAQRKIATRTHHGYCASALKRPVWGSNGRCLVAHHSVHPPEMKSGLVDAWRIRVEAGDFANILMETMYPGYALGHGADLDWAMDRGLALAVDASHLHIQKSAGLLSDATWRRLQDYPAIGELHLSANGGASDNHQPLNEDSFGREWTLERAREGIPVILECYFHRLTPSERERQLNLARP